MSSKIKQIRLPNDALDLFSTPDSKWSTNLIGTGAVTQLSIYALPGTRFIMVQEDSDIQHEIVIGGMGIFNFDLEQRPITTLKLAQTSYNNAKNNSHFIIIDMFIIEGREI